MSELRQNDATEEGEEAHPLVLLADDDSDIRALVRHALEGLPLVGVHDACALLCACTAFTVVGDELKIGNFLTCLCHGNTSWIFWNGAPFSSLLLHPFEG